MCLLAASSAVLVLNSIPSAWLDGLLDLHVLRWTVAVALVCGLAAVALSAKRAFDDPCSKSCGTVVFQEVTDATLPAQDRTLRAADAFELAKPADQSEIINPDNDQGFSRPGRRENSGTGSRIPHRDESSGVARGGEIQNVGGNQGFSCPRQRESTVSQERKETKSVKRLSRFGR